LVSLFDETLPGRISARKCTLFMAEEDTFHQCFRQGCTIDHHKTPAGAITIFMDGTGKKLFPGPGLPADQNIGCRVRRLGHKIKGASYLWTVPYDGFPFQYRGRLSGCLFRPVLEGTKDGQGDPIY